MVSTYRIVVSGTQNESSGLLGFCFKLTLSVTGIVTANGSESKRRDILRKGIKTFK